MSTGTQARIYRPTARNLELLAKRLQAGELVGVPTETVYGLAANALDAGACKQIFRAKGRPSYDPLIVHVHSLTAVSEIAHLNPAAIKVAKKFWPGPLTLVLPKTDKVPLCVTAGRDSVGVRMPSHPVMRRLLALTKRPLAAPSANPFGYISPTTAAHVTQGLGRKIRHVLDGGPSTIGVESTILDLRDPKRPTLLRPGAITRKQLEKALGRPVAILKRRPTSKGPATGEVAPGMLTRHYSPRTPVSLHESLARLNLSERSEAFVFMRKPSSAARNIFWFDARGNLHGIARQLFATLRRVDALKFRRIHVEMAPAGDLADAINDRLRRAAAK